MGEGRKEGREKVEREAVKNRYLLSLVPPLCVYIFSDVFQFAWPGINTAVAPVYLSEIAPVNLRGSLGTLNQFGIVSGLLLGFIFGLRQVSSISKETI